MAAVGLVVTLQDEAGLKSTMTVNVPSGETVAEYEASAQRVCTLVDALTDMVITRVAFVYEVALPGGLKSAAVDGSRAEHGGRFQFNASGGYYTSLVVPGIKESLITDGGKDINQSDSDVAAFITDMVDGLTGGLAPCDAREADITSISQARESFRSTRTL